MSKAFASIKQGLQEAIAHQQGRQAGVKLHVPPQVDVKEVRRLTGLTQTEFAARFTQPHEQVVPNRFVVSFRP